MVGNEVVFQPDEFSQLRILLESVGQTDVPDEVLRSLPRVHVILAVIVVGIQRLRPFEERRGIAKILLAPGLFRILCEIPKFSFAGKLVFRLRSRLVLRFAGSESLA